MHCEFNNVKVTKNDCLACLFSIFVPVGEDGQTCKFLKREQKKPSKQIKRNGTLLDASMFID